MPTPMTCDAMSLCPPAKRLRVGRWECLPLGPIATLVPVGADHSPIVALPGSRAWWRSRESTVVEPKAKSAVARKLQQQCDIYLFVARAALVRVGIPPCLARRIANFVPGEVVCAVSSHSAGARLRSRTRGPMLV